MDFWRKKRFEHFSINFDFNKEGKKTKVVIEKRKPF